MSWLRLSQVAALVNGRLLGPDRALEGVFTDTRAPVADRLFVALKGARFDAHDLVRPDLAAAGLMVSRPLDTGHAQVVVEDTRAALGRLAANWRAGIDRPLVGLTGSNGKTTVKEMTAAILACGGRVFATRGNLNNDIGVPLSLLELRPEHDYAVIEMGANHPGEIAYLTSLARPTVALVNNAGPAHLEGFGSIWGVSRAKGEIYAGLREGGTAVVNADDDYADYWREVNAARRVLTFGIEREADFHGRWSPQGPLHVTTPVGDIDVRLPLAGRHNAMNALAAATAAHAAGAALEDIRRGLEGLAPVKGRLQPRAGLGGSRLIDDTYNANPGSLAAAIAVLAQASGRRLLILGDMRELGADAADQHHAAGAQARAAGVDALFALGELSRAAVEGFGTGARHFEDVAVLVGAVRELFGPDLTVLVKGSRGMRMERVVEALAIAGSSGDEGGGDHHAA